jgi:hypothetical protein
LKQTDDSSSLLKPVFSVDGELRTVKIKFEKWSLSSGKEWNFKDVTLFPLSLVCWYKREKNGQKQAAAKNDTVIQV